MVKQPRLYPKTYAAQLLRIAAGDFATAKILSQVSGGRPENCLFIAQQSVEKGLKALLCFFGVPIRHTHDLGILAVELEPHLQIPDVENLLALTEYALLRRYLEGPDELTQQDLVGAVDLVEKFLAWAGTVMNPLAGP